MHKRLRSRLKHEFRIFVLKHLAPIPEKRSTLEHHQMIDEHHQKTDSSNA